MAELILAARATPKYAEGDILVAVNDRRIQCVHSEHICSARNFGFNGDGLRPLHTPAYYRNLIVSRRRFERVSHNEVAVFDGVEAKIYSNTPHPDDGKHIYVEEYLARRRQHARHEIFGTNGNELWFDYHKDHSVAKISLVWNMIESRLGLLKTNYKFWPLGQQEFYCQR